MATKNNKTTNGPKTVKQQSSGITPALSFLDDGNQYVLDLLTDVPAMEALQTEWQNLEQSCAEPFIYFQSYDWCKKWCDTFAAKSNAPEENAKPKIRIYALWRNHELIMVWPLMLVQSKANLLNLMFLTEPHGQYGNIICNRKLLNLETGKKIWKFITSNSGADAITLDKYPQSSMLKDIIANQGIVEKSERHSSILDLDGFEDWDEYRSSLNRKTRKQRNQRRNKLAKIGDLDYEVHFGGSPDYDTLVGLALKWKNVWLKETGRRANVVSDQNTQNFLSSLSGSEASLDQQANGAAIGVLSVGGKPIGIELGMCLDGHYYSYLGSFDWGSKRLSPGKTQIEEAQIWAKEIGLKKFDFLGDPADYKTEWTNATDALESRSVAVTLRGFIFCVCWKAYLRPATAFVFNRLDAQNRNRVLRILGLGNDKLPSASGTVEQSPPTVVHALNSGPIKAKN